METILVMLEKSFEGSKSSLHTKNEWDVAGKGREIVMIVRLILLKGELSKARAEYANKWRLLVHNIVMNCHAVKSFEEYFWRSLIVQRRLTREP